MDSVPILYASASVLDQCHITAKLQPDLSNCPGLRLPSRCPRPIRRIYLRLIRLGDRINYSCESTDAYSRDVPERSWVAEEQHPARRDRELVQCTDHGVGCRTAYTDTPCRRV